MRFAVIMSGVLYGMGRQAKCQVLATKSVIDDQTPPTYTHCLIVDAPSDMPNGDYEVEFEQEVAVARLQDGIWTVCPTLPHTLAEIKAFIAAGEGQPRRSNVVVPKRARAAD